jgi:hypothetical protein
MFHIDHKLKTVLIRWHGLRKYEGSEIVGMRGFPMPDYNLGQRYEMSLEGGIWKCWCYVGETDSLAPEPIYKRIKEDADLFAVIRACEEHAYVMYKDETAIADYEE